MHADGKLMPVCVFFFAQNKKSKSALPAKIGQCVGIVDGGTRRSVHHAFTGHTKASCIFPKLFLSREKQKKSLPSDRKLPGHPPYGRDNTFTINAL